MKAEQPKGIYMGNPADGSCSKQEQFIVSNEISFRTYISITQVNIYVSKTK